MGEFFNRLSGSEIIWVLAIIGATLYYITHIIAKQWRFVRQTEIEASLKAELIRQGKSLDEVAQVLRLSQTTVKDEDESEEESDKEKEEDFLADTIGNMLEQDKSAEDIARVIQAYQPAADVPPPLREERDAALKRAILSKMVEYERSGEDIETVLQACASRGTDRYRQTNISN
jgi:hypothetical protein